MTRLASSNSTTGRPGSHAEAVSSQDLATPSASASADSLVTTAWKMDLRTRWRSPSSVCTARLPKRVFCTGHGMAVCRRTWSSS
jgi:hypothetical protein